MQAEVLSTLLRCVPTEEERHDLLSYCDSGQGHEERQKLGRVEQWMLGLPVRWVAHVGHGWRAEGRACL